ncbi:thioredoxin [Hyaloraphidium curvatum]|nr:thioredoxin [Hyaloraphidium curvatum]
MTSPIVEVESTEHFMKLMETDKLFVVKGTASWCAPCHMVKPILDQLATDLKDQAVFCEVDVDKHENLAAQLKIHSMPTVLLIKQGTFLDQIVGAQPKRVFEERIKKQLDATVS